MDPTSVDLTQYTLDLVELIALVHHNRRKHDNTLVEVVYNNKSKELPGIKLLFRLIEAKVFLSCIDPDNSDCDSVNSATELSDSEDVISSS